MLEAVFDTLKGGLGYFDGIGSEGGAHARVGNAGSDDDFLEAFGDLGELVDERIGVRRAGKAVMAISHMINSRSDPNSLPQRS